jgi:hypothetical protein
MGTEICTGARVRENGELPNPQSLHLAPVSVFNLRAGWRPVRFVVRGLVSAFDAAVRWWRRAFWWCALRVWWLVATPLRGCLGWLRQTAQDCDRDAAQCEHWVSLT